MNVCNSVSDFIINVNTKTILLINKDFDECHECHTKTSISNI